MKIQVREKMKNDADGSRNLAPSVRRMLVHKTVPVHICRGPRRQVAGTSGSAGFLPATSVRATVGWLFATNALNNAYTGVGSAQRETSL